MDTTFDLIVIGTGSAGSGVARRYRSAGSRIDYADYRAVAGVQMPFQWTRTWTNNQVVVQLKEIRPNADIDPSRFSRPSI